ncbi:glycosyltransferase family 2 protein [Pseudobutyrivibrio xylanivorans]|uniref:Glycosyl transferase family 2 n=1 Tax=Pseudobutyrivibrio xylanivorans TaxID=185007 RepID=A0A5P6VQL1_PSEXY|nr:glycosyltransferase family A protein [Pseudobutyrivibrio xylanivorans]QFJ53979.1 glycosyl transferase family 2 [Pseudobutyrivibrio xylanivorans]
MKTCIATVIYTQAKPYLQDLLDSVDNQSDSDFDLLIINDNYSTNELEELNLPESAVVVDCHEKHLSIVGTRIEMLRQAKQLGYDLAILVDADDACSATRVAEYKKAYELDKTKVFFYNKFVTEDGKDVFKILPESVTDVKLISQQNFLGLSNTGIRLDAISDEFLDSLNECESPVFDWYLFTRILMDIGEGQLVDNATTIYRIYENNTAGTSRDLKKELDVKRKHYSILSERYDCFKEMKTKLLAMEESDLKLSNNHQGYWWSDIQMEDNYEI